jgi:hypothetical protein
MRTSSYKPMLFGLAAIEVASAIMAWRDLGRRADDEVRGSKRLWRVVIAMNPGNSAAYWVVGRR